MGTECQLWAVMECGEGPVTPDSEREGPGSSGHLTLQTGEVNL